jgi:hypothetical protein
MCDYGNYDYGREVVSSMALLRLSLIIDFIGDMNRSNGGTPRTVGTKTD